MGPSSELDTAVASAVTEWGVQDMSLQFQPRRRFWQGFTWCQRRQGQLIRSKCEYILSDLETARWRAIGSKRPRGYDSDHLMVVGILWLEDSASHAQYSRARRRFPIQWGRDHGVNAVFERCNQRKTALPRRERPGQAWISDRTWKLSTYGRNESGMETYRRPNVGSSTAKSERVSNKTVNNV